tara:strand:+ start:280 stop:501 length:222 start_codon:yes stop_codon:yes gene_type:complete
LERTQLNINIKPDLLKSLKREALETNKKLVELICEILNNYINNSINNDTESSKFFDELNDLKKRISLLEKSKK